MRWLTEKRVTRLSLLAAVLGIPLSIALTAWAIERADELAHATGQFNKARPHVFIENTTVDGPLTLYIGAAFEKKTVTVVPIPVAVRNDGEKTMKSIELTIRVPAFVAIDSDVLEAKVESELPIDQAPKRHFAKIGLYAYSSYSLPDIHPGQTIAVDDLMRLPDSSSTNHFSAQTEDGGTVSGDVLLTVSFPVRVSLAGEDLRSTDYDVDVLGVQSSDKSDLLKKFTGMALRERTEYRRNAGIWKYLFFHLHRTTRHGILVYPGYEEHRGVNGMALEIGTLVPSTVATYQIP